MLSSSELTAIGSRMDFYSRGNFLPIPEVREALGTFPVYLCQLKNTVNGMTSPTPFQNNPYLGRKPQRSARLWDNTELGSKTGRTTFNPHLSALLRGSGQRYGNQLAG